MPAQSPARPQSNGADQESPGQPTGRTSLVATALRLFSRVCWARRAAGPAHARRLLPNRATGPRRTHRLSRSKLERCMEPARTNGHNLVLRVPSGFRGI